MKQTTFCAILLLATGCTSPKKAHTADPLRVGTIVVTPSSDIDAALYVGTIEEETSAALSFPVAGTLARTYADEGQRVQQGQLLAELDPTSARQTFDAAQAALDQAKDACARLKQLYDAESLPEIKWVEAQTRLRQAESAYGIARKNLDDCKLYPPHIPMTYAPRCPTPTASCSRAWYAAWWHRRQGRPKRSRCRYAPYSRPATEAASYGK